MSAPQMLRRVNWSGPCIERPFIRQTAQFFIYWDHGKQRRVRRDDPRVHLEPCARCSDHPQTLYPEGYDA